MALVDFHIHSLYSRDGEFTPAELAGIARRSGIKVMSLTDHNTAAGTKEMLETGKEAGVKIIPGIEFDCYFDSVLFHVTGYGIDPENKRILEIDRDVVAKSKTASRQTLDLLRKAGINITNDEIFAVKPYEIITG
jgi:predicted metal-dependent phosphoesterase TrpH